MPKTPRTYFTAGDYQDDAKKAFRSSGKKPPVLGRAGFRQETLEFSPPLRRQCRPSGGLAGDAVMYWTASSRTRRTLRIALGLLGLADRPRSACALGLLAGSPLDRRRALQLQPASFWPALRLRHRDRLALPAHMHHRLGSPGPPGAPEAAQRGLRILRNWPRTSVVSAVTGFALRLLFAYTGRGCRSGAAYGKIAGDLY